MKKIQFFITIILLIYAIYDPVTAQIQIGADIDGELVGDLSGHSVSMPDAYTLAIGTPNNPGNGVRSGQVRIYQWNGSAWLQKGVDINGEAAEDESGYSVSMPDSNTVAIGAYGNDGNGSRSGHVRIYNWKSSAWVQKGADIDGEAAGDRSGWSVSMPDTSTVAIGAYLNGGKGHVRIYDWNGSAWIQKGADIDGEAVGDRSGWSVSMPNSNTVAIGATRNNGSSVNSGHVRIYNWNGITWAQKGADIDGKGFLDESGHSVSMPDTSTVAIGARLSDANGFESGQVSIYSWNGSSWMQKGADIDGEFSGDESGQSVSMPDSNTVAIGAHKNNGNGSRAGHVRIYQWCGNAWVQKGLDIDGEAISDESGWSVSMSDSNIVAIAAPRNDGNGNASGHVRVYSICSAPDSAIVNDTACNYYIWSVNNKTYTSSGTYIARLKNAVGCDSLFILNLLIRVEASLTRNAFELIANQTGATYQWINCNTNMAIPGETNQSFRVTENGSYAVVVTINGCSDTSDCETFAFIGLNERRVLSNDFVMDPNPAKKWVSIKTKHHNDNPNVFIYNSSGSLLKKVALKTSNERINIAEFPNGIYLVRYGNRMKKLLITR